MLKAGFEPELCYLSCFILSVTVFLLWRAHRVDGFIYIMKVEKGYPGERKHSIHTTLWFEGNKVQDWKWGCSASIPVMLKWDHCDFALLLILCAVNPTIHLQFNTAGLVGRKKELDNSIIRWTWKLWWCVAFLSTLKPKQCDLTLCVLLNSFLHLPGGCSSSESRKKASWWGRKGQGLDNSYFLNWCVIY